MRTTAKLAVVAGLMTFPLLSGGTAFAAAPDGSFVWNDNAKSQGNCVGVFSSRIIQNGQHVSGNGDSPYDQTTTPGSRAAAVHAAKAGPC